MTKLLQEHKPKLCCIMQNTYFSLPVATAGAVVYGTPNFSFWPRRIMMFFRKNIMRVDAVYIRTMESLTFVE